MTAVGNFNDHGETNDPPTQTGQTRKYSELEDYPNPVHSELGIPSFLITLSNAEEMDLIYFLQDLCIELFF